MPGPTTRKFIRGFLPFFTYIFSFRNTHLPIFYPSPFVGFSMTSFSLVVPESIKKLEVNYEFSKNKF